MMAVSTRSNLTDGEQVADLLASQDVLWLGADSPDGRLRPAEGRQRRGAAITTLEVPAGLGLTAGGPGASLVVVELRSEQALGLLRPGALESVLDAVAPDGAVRLVAGGSEQTRLLAQLLESWPAGWVLGHVDAERGAVSATVRRGVPDDVVDQTTAAELLWAALDRQGRELHERDQQARMTAHRLALRHRQLEEAVARETEGVAREHDLLDEITQLRALAKAERKARRSAEEKVAAQSRAANLVRRAAGLARRKVRRPRPSPAEDG